MFDSTVPASLQRDLGRALRSGRYERTDDGRILLASAGMCIGGAFSDALNVEPLRLLQNTVVAQGINALLDAFFRQQTAPTGFYIAPFSGNVAPDGATLTAANFTATQTEFTDYDETTRVEWTPAAAASSAIGNTASPADFTINKADSTIWGWALLTASAKSATTGVLVAAAKDDAARSALRVGDVLHATYQITGTST